VTRDLEVITHSAEAGEAGEERRGEERRVIG
jgi:hypothetical protein